MAGIDYLNDEQLLSLFKSRYRVKASALLELLKTVFAYDSEGRVIVHGVPVENSNIAELIDFQLNCSPPPWLRGEMAATIALQLDLSQHHRNTFKPKALRVSEDRLVLPELQEQAWVKRVNS